MTLLGDDGDAALNVVTHPDQPPAGHDLPRRLGTLTQPIAIDDMLAHLMAASKIIRTKFSMP